MSVFDFSKDYARYRWYITKRTSKGGYRRVPRLPVFETREEAEAALKKYSDSDIDAVYYIGMDFAR